MIRTFQYIRGLCQGPDQIGVKISWRVGTRGPRMPLASATCRVHAPAASTTTGASIVPFAVVTPVTLPALMFTASASVFGNKVAPWAAAALAYPTATCVGSKY